MKKHAAVGCDGKEIVMTTSSATLSTGVQSKSGLLPILFSAMIGLAIITVTGHVQANALHDAAHDTRHATGFPCH